MPRVSVIIPSYNHEKYVSHAIQSVLEQTYQDFEIVITDDGSADGTVNEIKKFKDSRIRLFCFEKNQGAAVASTHCVSKSKGEYIALLCSDDIFMSDKLEKQVKFLDEHHDIAAVFGYAKTIDDEGNDFTDKNHFYYHIFKQPNRTRFQWLNRFFYKGNCLCHPSILARRDIYSSIRSDPRYAQLGDFNRWVKICLKHDIHIIPEYVTKFRVREGAKNASASRPDSAIRNPWEFSEILKCFLDIKTVSDFLEIFPNASKYEGRIKDDLIPFFLALLALEHSSHPHQLFGIQTLYKFLADNKNAEKVEQECGFRYIDLIKLTGKYDTFNVMELKKKNSTIQNLESDIQNYEDKFQQLSDRMNNLSNSFHEGKKISSLNEDNIDSLIKTGNFGFQNGDYRTAISSFEKVLNLDSNNKRALKMLGESNHILGNHEDTEVLYSKLLTLESNAENLIAFAMIQKELEQFEKAVQNLEEARSIAAESQKFELHINLADCYTSLGRLDEGMDNYHTSLSIKRNDERPFIGLGMIALRNGNIHEALGLFQKALEINPQSSHAICGIGMVEWSKGENEKAFVRFKEALNHNGENVTALSPLIQLSSELDTLSEALTYINSYLDLHPVDMDMLLKQADVYIKVGQEDEAMKSLSRILMFNPGNHEAMDMIKVIEEKTSELSK